eukprot:1158535-Pelagomonas_calceolata.AAC.9
MGGMGQAYLHVWRRMVGGVCVCDLVCMSGTNKRRLILPSLRNPLSRKTDTADWSACCLQLLAKDAVAEYQHSEQRVQESKQEELRVSVLQVTAETRMAGHQGRSRSRCKEQPLHSVALGDMTLSCIRQAQLISFQSFKEPHQTTLDPELNPSPSLCVCVWTGAGGDAGSSCLRTAADAAAAD